MNNGPFFQNPAFRDYLALLFELHVLIQQGKDETPEGERLRERMDGPGSRLSSEEVEAATALSADFYSLGDPPRPGVLPKTPEAREGLEAAARAKAQKQYLEALRLLRQWEPYLNPADLSYARGTVWQELGQHRIAAEFFRRAADLNASNTNDRALWSPALVLNP